MIKLNKIIGIYKITNKVNGKVYIGESNDIERRWKEHRELLNSNTHHSYKLQEDWNKYGEDGFTFEILEEIKKLDSSYKTTMQLIYEEGKYIDKYNSINDGYNVEDTIKEVLSGKKVIMSDKIDYKYLSRLINKEESNIANIKNRSKVITPTRYTNDNFIVIPNNAVQNLNYNQIEKPSYIQLYNKRTIVYTKQLIDLQNINNQIYFSIDMILWMANIKNNIVREKKYFKDFLLQIHKNNLIEFDNNIDLDSLKASDFMIGRLNIYERNDNGSPINYFMLLDSEYDTIINKYSGDLDKYNLLNLFCNIKSRIKRNPDNISPAEREPEVAYPSYDTIMSDIFIESDKTLKKYIDALVDLDLIRYDCAGDMIFKIADSQPIRRKSNFTYTLFLPQWEIELESAISLFKSRKKKSGWDFLTKDKEISANEKRSITQRINMLEKISNESALTQTQKKELAKLKRQQEKWKREYDNKVDIRKLEEDKLKSENPDKELSEIYAGMGFDRKAERADKDEADYFDWEDEE